MINFRKPAFMIDNSSVQYKTQKKIKSRGLKASYITKNNTDNLVVADLLYNWGVIFCSNIVIAFFEIVVVAATCPPLAPLLPSTMPSYNVDIQQNA